MWTLDCEDALFQAKAEKGVMNAVNKQEPAAAQRPRRDQPATDAELLEHGKWTRKKVETMILVDVHQRDVFADMIKKKIQARPRTSSGRSRRASTGAHDDEIAVIAVADVDFNYCNEYLGVKERLVITPLTDRCYITLSQALGMCLGGAPAGPAGTGKTETTKDMGCTLGKYVS